MSLLTCSPTWAHETEKIANTRYETSFCNQKTEELRFSVNLFWQRLQIKEALAERFAQALPCLSLLSCQLVACSQGQKDMYSTALLHQNHLSCHPPRSSPDTCADTSLVGVGNRLTRPLADNGFPAWVQPDERAGLFWLSDDSGFWMLGKIVSGCLTLGLAFGLKIGIHKYMSITSRWQEFAPIAHSRTQEG